MQYRYHKEEVYGKKEKIKIDQFFVSVTSDKQAEKNTNVTHAGTEQMPPS